jgi:adenylate cyclase class 2
MEVEIKFKADKSVEDQIKKIAKLVCEKFEADLYFNSPMRDFRKTDEALRVRRDSEGVKITYKGPKIDAETKTREEIEIRVDDYDKAVELLKKLGFVPVGEVAKRRRIYVLDDVTICFDEVEGLGAFVEIETKSDQLESAKQKIFEVAKTLGFDPKNSIRKSYLELLLDI